MAQDAPGAFLTVRTDGQSPFPETAFADEEVQVLSADVVFAFGEVWGFAGTSRDRYVFSSSLDGEITYRSEESICAGYSYVQDIAEYADSLWFLCEGSLQKFDPVEHVVRATYSLTDASGESVSFYSVVFESDSALFFSGHQTVFRGPLPE